MDSGQERHLTNLLSNIRAAENVAPQPSRSYRDAFEDEEDEDEESNFRMGRDTEAYGAVPKAARQKAVPTSWEDADDDELVAASAEPSCTVTTATVRDSAEGSASNFFIDRKGQRDNIEVDSDDDSDTDEAGQKDDRPLYNTVGEDAVGEPEDEDMDDTELEALTPSVSEMYQMQESDFAIEFLSQRAANRRSNDRLQGEPPTWV